MPGFLLIRIYPSGHIGRSWARSITPFPSEQSTNSASHSTFASFLCLSLLRGQERVGVYLRACAGFGFAHLLDTKTKKEDRLTFKTLLHNSVRRSGKAHCPVLGSPHPWEPRLQASSLELNLWDRRMGTCHPCHSERTIENTCGCAADPRKHSPQR